MRPIDADALMKELKDFCDWCRDGRKQGADFVLDCVIPNAPTIDAVPVKHGEWIEYPTADGMNQCSICGVLRFGESNYCPNCGAKMERKEE